MVVYYIAHEGKQAQAFSNCVDKCQSFLCVIVEGEDLARAVYDLLTPTFPFQLEYIHPLFSCMAHTSITARGTEKKFGNPLSI